MRCALSWPSPKLYTFYNDIVYAWLLRTGYLPPCLFFYKAKSLTSWVSLSRALTTLSLISSAFSFATFLCHLPISYSFFFSSRFFLSLFTFILRYLLFPFFLAPNKNFHCNFNTFHTHTHTPCTATFCECFWLLLPECVCVCFSSFIL